MNMKLKTLFAAAFAVVGFCSTASAVTYPLPTDGSRLVGQNQVITIPEGNTQPLEYFAAEYQMGLSNMMEANPGVDTFLPKGGTVLNIPQQLILPDTVHEGIVINSAEMRLYYYPKGTNTVIVLPIGIGQLGKDTPINWTTKVERKKAGPTWTPTAKMHAEYRAAGEPLPAVVPAGPDNPMGLYALYIGRLYAIHGTNANFGIGLRVSHGCVRLRNEDIKFLFEKVPVGTRVQFIDEPVNTVIVLPIGIGQLGKDTPINWTTKVERKKAGPTWTPTAKMHAEYRAAGEPLPAVVPAGPDNPMGLYALYIGRLYAIHGTNANFGIGLRVSHGCVRLRNEDIKFLFEKVPVGTRVQFIDEPVKATTEPDGSRYIEVHNPLSTTEAQFEGQEIVPITLTKSVQTVTGQPDVDQVVLDEAIKNRSGMPVRLN